MAHIGEQLTTPVALVIFNRPEKTKKVFEQIRIQKPRQFFVISDGPRAGFQADDELVAASRQIIETVDWPCDVTRIYSDSNLGCRARIVSGLNQVFTSVDSAIVLEDDCVPSSDFFPFASELLARYEKSTSVFGIGGQIWEFPDQFDGESYFFSKYFSSWGWATWANRWRQIDHVMTSWTQSDSLEVLSGSIKDPMEIVYWQKTFQMTHENSAQLGQAWDYAVQYSMWREGLMFIRPTVNLIHNIGLGEQATHTRTDSPAISERVGRRLSFPLCHPEVMGRDAQRDAITNELRFGGHLQRGLRSKT